MEPGELPHGPWKVNVTRVLGEGAPGPRPAADAHGSQSRSLHSGSPNSQSALAGSNLMHSASAKLHFIQ